MFTLSAFADEISPDPQQQIDILKSCGVRHIEFRSILGTNVLALGDLQIDEFKSLLDKCGFKLSAIGSPIGKIRIDEPFAPHLDKFRRAIELCKVFGTPNIRIFSYYPPEGLEWDACADRRREMLDRMTEKCKIAEKAGVRLLHENEHRIYGDSPDRVVDLMKTVLEQTKSTALQAVYDPANYVYGGYDPWGGWQRTKQWTAHFHIKDWKKGDKHGSLPGEGEGCIPEVIADAVKRGYNGFATMEPHLLGGGPTGGQTGPELFPKAVAAFKKILDDAGAQYDARMQRVHVRVNDVATGKPTPVRIRFADAAGNHYMPFGHSTAFATGPNQDVGGKVLLGMKPHAYIDGSCEIALPPGPLQVHISKGPEFRSQTAQVQLTLGKLALRLEIERWCDLRASGWYSGDARAHFLPPHAALLEAQAEDLAVVNLLATECHVAGPFDKSFRAVPNLLAFSGQRPCLEVPGHVVVVNTHNRHPQLGSLGLLHCHRVVYPLAFGGPHGVDDWTLADWCDQCHRKNGLVVWTQTIHESADFAYGEPLADLILGKVDAFEVDFFEDSPFDNLPLWYNLLAIGLKVPLVGASGKESNGVPLGAMRTYARLSPGQTFDYGNWIEAVRAGRTFVTNGPLLTLKVDGHEPGATLDLVADTVHVQAEASSQVPFTHLEIVLNGIVVATAPATGDPCTASLEVEVPAQEGGWLAARCRGEQQLLQQPANQRVFAHTSPVWLHRPGTPPPVDVAAVKALRKELTAMQSWAATQARCENDHQREHLAGIVRTALARLDS